MANHFGSPVRGAKRQSIRDVRIVKDGQRWTASWHVEEGNLLVWSAWGSKSEPVGKTTELAARATVLLGEIIDQRAAQ
jgi:hypothetical protein